MGGKAPKKNYALKDGDEDRDETAGMMICGASNNRRPTVLNADNEPVAEDDDGVPYSGCYVHAIVTLYYMAKHKAVCATLEGVRFAKDGEAFGAAPASSDDFADFDDEDDRPAKKPSKAAKRSRDDDEDEDEDEDDRPAKKPSKAAKRSRDDDEDV
jgi:hypothetical protein